MKISLCGIFQSVLHEAFVAYEKTTLKRGGHFVAQRTGHELG